MVEYQVLCDASREMASALQLLAGALLSREPLLELNHGDGERNWCEKSMPGSGHSKRRAHHVGKSSLCWKNREVSVCERLVNEMDGHSPGKCPNLMSVDKTNTQRKIWTNNNSWKVLMAFASFILGVS